jgi:branched-chain amino acid transport system permease protein
MKLSVSFVTKVTAVALLFALPAILSPSLVNAVNQMLIAALFACAFNLLCGQGGMLSFGHSAYFGIGSFAAIHAMGSMGNAGILPTPLLPLAGAVAGLLLGVVAGWFSTKRSGVYFAMITLALAALLHSVAPHLKSLFGGEAGLSGMRQPALGLTFGSDIQVYYLTLIWVLISIGLLFLLTRTPLGRHVFALRENSHRLRFLGYNIHNLGTMTFALSAMFSGVAGALQAISIEASNYVVFDMHLSAEVVLNTYIGGVHVFLGPVLGAAVMTFLGNSISDLTRNWLLYKGILFVLVMMFMPTGIAGLLQLLGTHFRKHSMVMLLPVLLLSVAATLLLLSATVFSVEIMQRMLSQDYQMMAQGSNGAPWPGILLFGREWIPGSLSTWLLPLALFAGGFLLTKKARNRWKPLQENCSDDVSESLQSDFMVPDGQPSHELKQRDNA